MRRALYTIAFASAISGCANQEYLELKETVARQAATIAEVQSKYETTKERLDQIESSESSIIAKFHELENKISVYQQASDLDKITEQKKIEFDILLLARRVETLESRAVRNETLHATEVRAREEAITAERAYASEQVTRIDTALGAEQTTRARDVTAERTYASAEVRRLEDALSTITKFIAGCERAGELPTTFNLYEQLRQESAHREADIARVDSAAEGQARRLTTAVDKVFGSTNDMDTYPGQASLLQRVYTLSQWVRQFNHDQKVREETARGASRPPKDK